MGIVASTSRGFTGSPTPVPHSGPEVGRSVGFSRTMGLRSRSVGRSFYTHTSCNGRKRAETDKRLRDVTACASAASLASAEWAALLVNPALIASKTPTGQPAPPSFVKRDDCDATRTLSGARPISKIQKNRSWGLRLRMSVGRCPILAHLGPRSRSVGARFCALCGTGVADQVKPRGAGTRFHS